MNVTSSSSEKIYLIPLYVNVYLLMFPLIGAIFVGVSLLIFFLSSINRFENFIGVIVGVAFFVLMMRMYVAMKRMRLVLTDNGITYYGWGYLIYTPWQNVVGITCRQLYYNFPLNLRKFQVLQLRQPSVLGMKLVEGKQKGVAALETAWWNPSWSMKQFAGIVPLTPMLHGRNWKERALCRDIQEHAPWIVIDEGVQ